MNNKLGLFVRASKAYARTKISATRKLYTDHIYPYPFNYINNKVWPSQVGYRETFKPAPWDRTHDLSAKWGMRVFWIYWWSMLFHHPEAVLGHGDDPDPTLWTDEELGIPPVDAGSYEDWLATRDTSN